jgi:hypothetical protein
MIPKRRVGTLFLGSHRYVPNLCRTVFPKEVAVLLVNFGWIDEG